jgi:hypothetical protein
MKSCVFSSGMRLWALELNWLTGMACVVAVIAVPAARTTAKAMAFPNLFIRRSSSVAFGFVDSELVRHGELESSPSGGSIRQWDLRSFGRSRRITLSHHRGTIQ